MFFSQRFLKFCPMILVIVMIICYVGQVLDTGSGPIELLGIFNLGQLRTSERSIASQQLNDSSTGWLDQLCPKYHLEDNQGYTLPKETLVEGSIFFTHTSCQTHFTVREACAVESASLHHPHQNILVFMTTPIINDTHPLHKVLVNLENVRLSWMDLDEVFEDTHLKDWFLDRLWLYNTPKAPTFVSDAARVVLLWRYGGTYIDLDAITLRPLPRVPNYVGRLDDIQITQAIASFSKGHKLIDMLRKAIPTHFDAFDMTSIGPALLTQCLHLYCPGILDQRRISNEVEYCDDVTVFPRKYFYPHYSTWESIASIFSSGSDDYYKQYFESADAYSLHLYNSLTSLLKTNLFYGDSLLSEAAKRNCPNVYATALKYNLDL